MTLIPVVTSSGMTVEQGLICKCNRCGHRWLPTSTKKLPKRCGKCKSAWWNRKKGTAGRPKKQVGKRVKKA